MQLIDKLYGYGTDTEYLVDRRRWRIDGRGHGHDEWLPRLKTGDWSPHQHQTGRFFLVLLVVTYY